MRNLNPNVNVINTNKVKSTDFNLFDVFATNRYCGAPTQTILHKKEVTEYEIRLKHIAKCMIEFGKEQGSTEPLFDSASPILVVAINGKWYIVDGQHRYNAAKMLNIPFWYQVIPEIETKEEAESYFKRYNSLQKRWTKLDDLASSARQGNENSQFILQISELYDLPTNVVMYFADKSGHKIESHNKNKNYDFITIQSICELNKKMSLAAANNDKDLAFKIAKNRDFTHSMCSIYARLSPVELNKVYNRLLTKPCGLIPRTTSIQPYLYAFGITKF